MIESGISVNSNTVQANVALLEDHVETAVSISQELQRDGKIVRWAKTLDDFENIIKGADRFDVCSIDWDIGDRFVGAIALSLIKRYERDAGKVVYSVHVNKPRIVNEAIEGGADAVLKKIGSNYDEYRIKVEEVARLGIARQIFRRLDELGFPLATGITFDEKDEKQLAVLCAQARQAAKAKALAGEDDELIQLLKRRGWWMSFDVASYSNLPMEEQLALLFQYVGARAGDVNQIFQCSLIDAQKILNENKVSNKLEKSADEMLSILAYLLRISRYEPELMSHYWTVTNLFDASLSSPPWDTSGLSAYLKSSGVAGIEDALHWIRSH
ncbi:MAG TPA: hypothetical protein VGB98_04295 [Pyrinomonadaceae bacterium]